MAFQLLRTLLVLAAVFIPVLAVRVLFGQKFEQWFVKKETSWFSIGLPATKEGYMLSAFTIIIIIGLLLLINYYM